MELILFKDLLKENAEPQYGLLEDGDEPSVYCLCCGRPTEFGDYEILERLPWHDLSELITQHQKYVVCMDSTWVRDSQMMKTDDLSDTDFENIDFMSSDNDDRWHDMEPNPFIAVVEATSEDDACQKAAEQKHYDKRCLFAVKI